VTLTGFVDGVTEDLKDRVLAAFQIIGAENNSRALADTVLALEHGNTGIAVAFCFFSSHSHYLPYFSILASFIIRILCNKVNIPQQDMPPFVKNRHYLL
jgi:hypothetical protein